MSLSVPLPLLLSRICEAMVILTKMELNGELLDWRRVVGSLLDGVLQISRCVLAFSLVVVERLKQLIRALVIEIMFKIVAYFQGVFCFDMN